MARRYRKKRSHGKAKPSIVSFAPVAVLAMDAYKGYKEGGGSKAVDTVIGDITGMHFYMFGGDGSTGWQPARMLPFYGTVAATYVGKKLIAMSGVNRAMKGLPFRL